MAELFLADWLNFLDPVSLLEMHQSVSLTLESFSVAEIPFFPQVLANQIEHGCEGAEVVVLLDMELQASFVHRAILQRDR